jgi:hypothetical protein
LSTVDSATADVPNGRASLPGTGLPSRFPDATVTLPEVELTTNRAEVTDCSTRLPENFALNPSDNTSKISYLCPPNHTTLVGFLTLLLSRWNVALNADSVSKEIKSEVSDTTNSDCSLVTSSGRISPAEAGALWKERLASLFVWRAIMSNTVPKVMDLCLKAMALHLQVPVMRLAMDVKLMKFQMVIVI